MSGTVVIEKICAEDLDIGVGGTNLTAPAGGDMPGTRINLATFGIMRTFTLGAGTILAGAKIATILPMAGVRLGMPCIVAPNVDLLVLGLTGFIQVSADNTVRFLVFNTTALPVSLGTITFSVIAFPIPGTLTPVVASLEA